VKPIANSEWMAAMMRRSPLFEGMDIPVVPPIVDNTFTAKALKLKADFTTEATEFTEVEAGVRLAGQAGAAFSNPFTSELARNCENTSLIRTAEGSASLPATSYSLPVTAPKAQSLDARRSIASAAPATLTSEATFGRLPRATPCAGGLDSPMPRWAGGSRFVVGMSARSLTDGGKGIVEFFQRLPLDRAFLKETTFVLIGEGNIRVPAGLDSRFMGLVESSEKLARIYRSLDLFVSASAMETFGMAILEAQACGTPVVAFETGGTPEAVCPAGSKSVRNGDWAGLFRELEAIFESAMKGLGKNHQLSEWVATRHRWQAIAEKQIAIYGRKGG
jgi:glycosyltransferase involved in cell wall biosynthesis